MQGTQISHYRIGKRLGGGGMGIIHQADDTRLNRTVAIKFLPEAQTSDPQAVARFQLEARTASGLNHANICTIYDVGDYEGKPYIVMELLEGKTLRQVLAERPMEISDLFDTCVQITDALEAAHAKGIIHRDIKPANVFITPRGAKVLDFGVAKLLRAGTLAQTVDIRAKTVSDDQLTQPGDIVGTVSHMSPEQARGETIDVRSDLFSLGVLMYEMATGVQPFQGTTTAASYDAILNKRPPLPSQLNHRVPAALDTVIYKLLQKDPQDRYTSAKSLLSELRQLKRELDTGVISSGSGTKSGFARAAGDRLPSIAILPFWNVGSDPENEFFGDGLAEELITQLSKISGLQVLSRSSSFAFKGKQQDVREVGRQMGVGTVLEGSVRRAGNRLRISAQLVNVTDGYQVWSDRYDRQMDDIFEVQDEIAQSITQALKVMLTEEEKHAISKVPTQNVEAYECYLRGRQYQHQFHRKSIELARNMFARAVEIDPRYTLAYCGIADCHSFAYLNWESNNQRHLQQADEASQKALELDSELAESHVSRGLLLSIQKKYDEAHKEFQRALQLNPSLYEAYYYQARVCWAEGRAEQAAELYENAARVRPDDFQALMQLATVYEGLGNKSMSTKTAYRALEIAERHLKLNPNDSRALVLGATKWCLLGKNEQALEWANRAMSLDAEDTMVLYNLACVYSLVGKVDDAMACLSKAIDHGYAHKNWIENDSDLNAIRSHPDYQQLLAKI